uniref:Uncharacterized protein n=1 Tax=Arundo donax TaxID=35708 RepID=A0A0A9S7J8_ARUDO
MLVAECDFSAHNEAKVGADPPRAGHGHNCWRIALGITVNAS